MMRWWSTPVLLFCALLVAACGKQATEQVGSQSLEQDSPAEAVTRIAADLKRGNLLGVLEAALPPAEFARMKSEYDLARQQPPSDEDRAEFAAMMAKLTAPGAEQEMMAEAEVALAHYESEMQAQMPLMLAMGRGFAVQALQESKEISDPQKTQITQVLDAVVKWAESVPFADRGLAREAIAHTTATARSLELSDLDAVQKLEFEQAMAKAGIAFQGSKQVLAVYGLKLDDTFDSVNAELVRQDGDSALVRIGYKVFDQPLSFETEMVRRDGRWYGKDALAGIERRRAQDAKLGAEVGEGAAAEAAAVEAPDAGAVTADADAD